MDIDLNHRTWVILAPRADHALTLYIVVFVWRTYAIWNQSMKILYALGAMWTVSGC